MGKKEGLGVDLPHFPKIGDVDAVSEFDLKGHDVDNEFKEELNDDADEDHPRAGHAHAVGREAVPEVVHESVGLHEEVREASGNDGRDLEEHREDLVGVSMGHSGDSKSKRNNNNNNNNNNLEQDPPELVAQIRRWIFNPASVRGGLP